MDPLLPDLCFNCNPKKIKIFLWKLSWDAINSANRIWRHLPHVSISPSWCRMCSQHAESPAHLFLLPFATSFWDMVLQAFG